WEGGGMGRPVRQAQGRWGEVLVVLGDFVFVDLQDGDARWCWKDDSIVEGESVGEVVGAIGEGKAFEFGERSGVVAADVRARCWWEDEIEARCTGDDEVRKPLAVVVGLPVDENNLFRDDVVAVVVGNEESRCEWSGVGACDPKIASGADVNGIGKNNRG